MKLGYNTNGLAHHRLIDAIDLLADVGYQSIAITLDAGTLDPFQDPAALHEEIAAVRAALDRRGLARVVETGARYLLNPRLKHDPTLLDPNPERRAIRVDFLKRSIDIARALDAPLVSIWSGRLPDSASDDAAMNRLCEALTPVLRHAEHTGTIIGFEPEPGMWIELLEQFRELAARVNHPLLRLTLDVGHVHCSEDPPIAKHIEDWGNWIVNVHVEDMMRGVHEHLPFGQGTMEFGPIFAAFERVNYRGGVHVELSRDSHRAVDAVCESYKFLAPLARGL